MKRRFVDSVRRMFISLSIRNYRLFAMGNWISQIGGWIQIIAVNWLSLQLTNSGFQLGLIDAMIFVPILLAGTWGGVIADRFSKRSILLYTQSGLGIVACIASLLIWTDLMTLWTLYALALSIGLIRIFDDPARASLASDLVESRYIKNAVSLNGAMFNSARIIGPAIAGVLIAVSGLAICFFLNALSFVASVASLMSMHTHELHVSHHGERKAGQIRESLHYVLATPSVRTILVIAAIVGTFAYEFSVTLPLVVKNVLHGDATTLATLWTCMGIGAVCATLYSASVHAVSERVLAVLLGLFAGSLILVGLVSEYLWVLVSVGILGFVASSVMANILSIVQLEVRPDMRGRVMALRSMAVVGSTAIGAPLIGYISDLFGVQWGLMVGAASALVSVVILLRAGKCLMYEAPALVPITANVAQTRDRT